MTGRNAEGRSETHLRYELDCEFLLAVGLAEHSRATAGVPDQFAAAVPSPVVGHDALTVSSSVLAVASLMAAGIGVAFESSRSRDRRRDPYLPVGRGPLCASPRPPCLTGLTTTIYA